MSRSSILARSLAAAQAALQARDPDRARRILEALGAEFADHPARLHLLALVHKARGDISAAERAFRSALRAAPTDPVLHGNLANLLRQVGRLEEAETCYREALRLNPTFADARRNLGLLLAAEGRDRGGIQALEQAVELNPEDVAAWTTLGQCHRRVGELESSERCFRRALTLRADHVNALAGLGQTLRMLGRPDEAGRCFDAALERSSGAVELLVARADAAADQGEVDRAAAGYRAALARNPTHVGAHTQLSELLWQMEASASYGPSFREALAEHPDSPDLLAAWCEGLANTGFGGEALRELESRADLVAKHPGLLGVLAKRQAAAGMLEDAQSSFGRAMQLAPGDPDLALDYAQFAIYRGDYERALAALSDVERVRPDDQLMWACRGLCWRLIGDPRHDWLNDYDAFVRTYEIDCPPGYGTLERFLAALTETLTTIHHARNAPAHQSLRGGTQTAPRLFYRPDPVIQALRQVLTRAVERYVEALPVDVSHPLLRRRSRRFHFAGSWSVRLRSEGYHVNHVHPQGWISSSHYVSVPADMVASPDDTGGCLKFGESGLGLGDREIVARLVRPEAGTVTLFPSYAWHGTVPFQSSEPRITTPFDVVPLP